MHGHILKKYRSRGFTIVEIIIVIAVIGILAGIVTISYGAWQQRTALNTLNSDLTQAAIAAKSQKNFSGSYPATMAALEQNFSASPNQTVTLKMTGGTSTYQGLTASQNAALFVLSCNNAMPIASGSYVFATQCAGQWGIDVNGGSHSTYLSTPIQSNFTLVGTSCTNPSSNPGYCNPYYEAATTAANSVRSAFLLSGGTFPVAVENNSSASLPTPVSSTGGQTCLEARHRRYTNIVQHMTLDKDAEPQSGPC